MYIRSAFLFLLASTCFAQTPTMNPTPTTTLTGANVTFYFHTNGNSNVEKFWFYLGTAQENWNLYNDGVEVSETAVVTGIPTDGSTIYGAFFTKISGSWSGTNITFTAATSGPIIADTTLNVPSQYDSIHDALTSLDMRDISKDALVTIQVADGTHQYDTQVLFNHPNGNNIQIIGNTSNPSACELEFDSSYGFVVADGNHLKFLDGFTLTGGGSYYGLYINQSASLKVGDNVTINDFSYGAVSALNSRLTIGAASITDNDYGIRANAASSIHATNTTISNNTNIGVHAKTGSFIIIYGTGVSSNGTNFSPAANTTGNSNSYIDNP